MFKYFVWRFSQGEMSASGRQRGTKTLNCKQISGRVKKWRMGDKGKGEIEK